MNVTEIINTGEVVYLRNPNITQELIDDIVIPGWEYVYRQVMGEEAAIDLDSLMRFGLSRLQRTEHAHLDYGGEAFGL
jgi:hypothetical protein